MRAQLRAIESQKSALAEQMRVLQDREKAIASALIDADIMAKETKARHEALEVKHFPAEDCGDERDEAH